MKEKVRKGRGRREGQKEGEEEKAERKGKKRKFGMNRKQNTWNTSKRNIKVVLHGAVSTEDSNNNDFVLSAYKMDTIYKSGVCYLLKIIKIIGHTNIISLWDNNDFVLSAK